MCRGWQATRHRWSDWARFLIERHGFVMARHSAPVMILVHPLAMFHFMHEHWMVSSRQFHPQVHLAIQPILRHAVWREQKQATVALQAPLHSVLQRLDQIDELRTHRRGEITQESMEKLVRRVVRQTQRLEEKVIGNSVLISRQSPTMMATQAASSAIPGQAVANLPAISNVRAAHWMQNPAPPAVNIEQLTDQVMRQFDRRITAWRERTARA